VFRLKNTWSTNVDYGHSILRAALCASDSETKLMKLNSNIELYKTIDTIMSELNVIGLNAEAVELKNALDISAHPGEIVGETRNVLKSLAKNNVLNLLLKNNIKDCIKYIDKIF